MFVLEEDAGFVVAGVAGLHLTGEEGGDIERFAGGLAMVVGAMAIGQEPEAVDDGEGYGAGVTVAALEPANRAGAAACEDDAFVVGFPQDGVDALGFPDGDHVEGVAAAYDDGVHAHELLFEGLLPGRTVDPDRKPVGFYGEVVAEGVPIVDAIGIVGGGRGQEADLWVGFACEGDHFTDKGLLKGAAVGEDSADGGLGGCLRVWRELLIGWASCLGEGGCGEQVEQGVEEELFHGFNVRNSGGF